MASVVNRRNHRNRRSFCSECSRYAERKGRYKKITRTSSYLFYCCYMLPDSTLLSGPSQHSRELARTAAFHHVLARFEGKKRQNRKAVSGYKTKEMGDPAVAIGVQPSRPQHYFCSYFFFLAMSSSFFASRQPQKRHSGSTFRPHTLVAEGPTITSS